MLRDVVPTKHPLVEYAFGYIRSRFSPYEKTLLFILDHFDEEYFDFCEEILSVVRRKYGTAAAFNESLRAFIKFSLEFLVLQVKLNKERRYLYASFDEVNRAVYQHEGMKNYYLDGQLLSQLFWPNHYKMVQYFTQLRSLVNSSSVVLDVPSGGGMYSYVIAKHFPYQQFLSMDISPYAAEYTNTLLMLAPFPTRHYSVEVCDVYAGRGVQAYDFISCGELLEHLEAPEELLRRLYVMLKDHGTLFLTTAIWAANIDHIYLFRNVAEVREMLQKYFCIHSELILPVSLEEYRDDMHEVPMNYACVLKKREA